MMALVWLIDIFVIGVKILGGRMKVNPILRFGLWIAVLCVLAVAVGLVGLGLVVLQQHLSGEEMKGIGWP